MKQTKNSKHLLKIIDTALLAALICVATMVVKIPTPTNGYIHLGDAFVLLAGFLLGPVYGFLAAAIGSMFADVFSGYMVYAVATFVIKGLTACCGYFVMKALNGFFKKAWLVPYILGGIVAEIVMVLGYYLFAATVCGYGFAGALVGIPGNLVQGASGIMISMLLMAVFEKTNAMKRMMKAHGFMKEG